MHSQTSMSQKSAFAVNTSPDQRRHRAQIDQTRDVAARPFKVEGNARVERRYGRTRPTLPPSEHSWLRRSRRARQTQHWSWSEEITDVPNGDASLNADGEVYCPSQINALALGKMTETDEAHQRSVQQAVVIVPAYRHDAQRQANKDVRKDLRFGSALINETTVAARTSGVENKDNGKTEMNLDGKFEMSRQCVPTRRTERHFWR